MGRSSLRRAVESVLLQSVTDVSFQVIVVNDAGSPLPHEDWQNHPLVEVVDTHRRERSVARNVGAALARGLYLHFLDDDDWLLPGALQRLYRLSQQQDAAWLYGSTQLIDRKGNRLATLCPDMQGNCFIQAMAGEWIPLQSSLIRSSAFVAVGGFNPLLAGPEDNDLLRRIALRYSLAGTGDLVAAVEWRGTESTTDYKRHPLQSRQARERILSAYGAFVRMKASASSAYWQGRIIRAYLTSAVWNFQRGRILPGISRAVFACAALLRSARCWFSASFWRAVLRRHESVAFCGMKEEAGVGLRGAG